jgi:hypothetical protein
MGTCIGGRKAPLCNTRSRCPEAIKKQQVFEGKLTIVMKDSDWTLAPSLEAATSLTSSDA